jgi:hypothetical protein
VGNEGVVGIPLVMGGGIVPSSTVVGPRATLPAAAPLFKREFSRARPMQRLVLRYTRA